MGPQGDCKANAVWATALMVALATAVFSTSAHAVIIQDGDFNQGITQPSEGETYYQNFANSSLIDGVWTVYDNNVDIVGPGSTPYAMDPPAGIACCVIYSVGTGSTGGVYQEFTVNLTGLYTLDFYYANNSYSTSTASAVVAVNTAAPIAVGTPPGGTSVTHDTSVAPANMNWTLFTETLLLDASTDYYLIFDTTYGANSGGVEFTDVQLTPAPLPATWSMLLIGLVGCGFMAHRGNNKRSAAHLLAAESTRTRTSSRKIAAAAVLFFFQLSERFDLDPSGSGGILRPPKAQASLVKLKFAIRCPLGLLRLSDALRWREPGIRPVLFCRRMLGCHKRHSGVTPCLAIAPRAPPGSRRREPGPDWSCDVPQWPTPCAE